MADFNKRHYGALAAILRGFTESYVHKHTLVMTMASMLDRDNREFDSAEFIEACESGDKEKLVMTEVDSGFWIDQNGGEWEAVTEADNRCGECGKDSPLTIDNNMNGDSYCQDCLESKFEVEWKNMGAE